MKHYHPQAQASRLVAGMDMAVMVTVAMAVMVATVVDTAIRLHRTTTSGIATNRDTHHRLRPQLREQCRSGQAVKVAVMVMAMLPRTLPSVGYSYSRTGGSNALPLREAAQISVEKSPRDRQALEPQVWLKNST